MVPRLPAILVTTSLEIPAWQATLRATTPAGITFTTHGALNAAAITIIPRRIPNTDDCGNGQVHCFSPVFYAINTVLPLISLDQRSTWYPDPGTPYGTFMQWWLNCHPARLAAASNLRLVARPTRTHNMTGTRKHDLPNREAATRPPGDIRTHLPVMPYRQSRSEPSSHPCSRHESTVLAFDSLIMARFWRKLTIH